MTGKIIYATGSVCRDMNPAPPL